MKTKKQLVILPQLRKITKKNKRHIYKLSDPQSKRILAIEEGINNEKNKTKKNKREAAIKKKARFNLLRIYRKNKDKNGCKKLTNDMRYMDKKYGLGSTKMICGGSSKKELNILNKNLQVCSLNPLTGYKRDGYCSGNNNDIGKHFICSKMNDKFLNFSQKKNNNLKDIVKKGDNWCICENRWLEAYKEGKDPKVIKKSTSNKIMLDTKLKINSNNKKKFGGKLESRKKSKIKFLYNPNNPKKAFDVYINKNPSDTINIKYTTVEDVKNTIKKLERLYKNNKYPHKRIWQVAMILKVRLEAILKHKIKYKNAKALKSRFNLANRYFKFLKVRTKKHSIKDRKNLKFKI